MHAQHVVLSSCDIVHAFIYITTYSLDDFEARTHQEHMLNLPAAEILKVVFLDTGRANVITLARNHKTGPFISPKEHLETIGNPQNTHLHAAPGKSTGF